MISYDDVADSLLEAEQNYDTSLAALTRMQPLYMPMIYAMLKNLTRNKSITDRLMLEGESEFLQAVNGKNPAEVIYIMDDFLEAVRSIHPKMYNNLVAKIQKL